MNIDNEPGRWRCKNQKAPLLGEIKITGGGTAGNWCTFALLENKEIIVDKYILFLRNVFCCKDILRIFWCFVKYVFKKSWASECLSGQMWQKGRYIWKLLPAGEYPESIWEYLGASGGIWRHRADWSVFNRLLRDAHENKYFKHPLNAHQPHPQKNMMGWDIQAYLKLKALVSQELNF